MKEVDFIAAVFSTLMELIQTQRGAPCLINDGHRYRRDKKRESHTTWRCCLKGCPSRCTTDHSATVFLKNPSDHIHEKLSTPQIDIEKARTSVTLKAVEDMHAQVDKMVCEEISASSLSFKHVHALKSAVYRERCKLRPFILSTVSILLDLVLRTNVSPKPVTQTVIFVVEYENRTITHLSISILHGAQLGLNSHHCNPLL